MNFHFSTFLTFCILELLFSQAFILNATGGSFPEIVYSNSIFAYKFVQPNITQSYSPLGSSLGKCNIMGFWYGTNVPNPAWTTVTDPRTLDQNLCGTKQSLTSCSLRTPANCPPSPPTSPDVNNGYNVPPPRGINNLPNCPSSNCNHPWRPPLVDYAGSDSLLSAVDYASIPDLQMYPAVAGGSVPVYNIPELSNYTLTLGKKSIVGIFMGE